MKYTRKDFFSALEVVADKSLGGAWRDHARAVIDEVLDAVFPPVVAGDDTPANPAECLWYPPVPEGFGPWVEFREGDKPPRNDKLCRVLLRHERHEMLSFPSEVKAGAWNWTTIVAYSAIVAYSLKLEGAP